MICGNYKLSCSDRSGTKCVRLLYNTILIIVLLYILLSGVVGYIAISVFSEYDHTGVVKRSFCVDRVFPILMMLGHPIGIMAIAYGIKYRHGTSFCISSIVLTFFSLLMFITMFSKPVSEDDDFYESDKMVTELYPTCWYFFLDRIPIQTLVFVYTMFATTLIVWFMFSGMVLYGISLLIRKCINVCECTVQTM